MKVEVRVDPPHGEIDIVKTLLEQILILLIGYIPLELLTQLIQTPLLIIQQVHNLQFEQLELLQLHYQRVTCTLKRLLIIHTLLH